MPVVNIRDDDGDIQDVVNIPISSGGGGGDSAALEAHIADTNNPHQLTAAKIGAAPEKGIVAKSPFFEAEGREEYDALDWWVWEKYIDGTVAIYTGCTVDLNLDLPTLEFTEVLPFEAYNVSFSYIIEPYDKYFEDVNFEFGAASDIGGWPEDIFGAITMPESTLSEMAANEEYVSAGRISVTITGKWRKD